MSFVFFKDLFLNSSLFNPLDHVTEKHIHTQSAFLLLNFLRKAQVLNQARLPLSTSVYLAVVCFLSFFFFLTLPLVERHSSKSKRVLNFN